MFQKEFANGPHRLANRDSNNEMMGTQQQTVKRFLEAPRDNSRPFLNHTPSICQGTLFNECYSVPVSIVQSK